MPQTAFSSWVAILVMLSFPLVAAGPAIAPASHASGPTLAPAIFHGAASSTNWGGYAVTAARGSVSSVVGSWIEPAIQGTCPVRNQYSSFWVGIDGYNSGTVEQTGTDSDCQGGVATYYAWYEFYPKASHVITTLTIKAGDVISASVTFSKTTNKFTTKITDVTTGKSFSTASTVKGAHRSSAEWIAEAPSSSGGVLPLANFGTVYFGFDTTSVSGTDSATIGTTTGTMGSFSTLTSITMVNSAGTATKASPSSVSTDGTSFSVAWKSAGP
jgi:hypothetical protein